jgi:hypothetical protein
MKLKFAQNWKTPSYGEHTTITADLETGTVTVSQEIPPSQGDGTPIRQWHGIERVYDADNSDSRVDLDELREWLETGEGAQLFGRIIAGGSREWDGNNHTGRMTDDALDAEEQLSDTFELLSRRRPELVDWTCDEWFGQCMGEVYNQESAEAAREFGSNSQEEGVLLDCDPGEWCKEEWLKHRVEEE